MIGTPTNVNDIREGIVKHGASSSACATLLAETEAANESIASGLYVTWSPHPSSTLGPSAADELRSGAGQCCRVGSTSVCMCGHSLENHKPVVPSKSGGYTKPPTCLKCKRCTGYQYVPSRPEECGQWWLSRRGDFNLLDWRKVKLFSTCTALVVYQVWYLNVTVDGYRVCTFLSAHKRAA